MAVRVVQVGSREAVAVRRVAKGAEVVRGAADNRVAEAKESARGAGRAGLVDVRVDRKVVRGKGSGLSVG